MNRWPGYVLLIFSAITILLLGLVGYITIAFDPNAYKAQVTQLIRDRTQRDLRLEGDIRLRFFPAVGVETGRIALSEYQSGETFAAAENIRVSLELLPLLRKQLVLDEIVIIGLNASLVRFRDGRTNIDDLIAEREEPEQFELGIARIRMEEAAISLSDEASGVHFLLRDLDLEAGRTGLPSRSGNSMVESKVKLAFRMDQPEQPETEAGIRLTFDLEAKKDDRRYALKHLDLKADARLPGIPALVIHSTGNFSAQLAEGREADEFVADDVIVDISAPGGEGEGKTGVENTAGIRLQIPRLNLTGDKLAGDGMNAMAKIIRPDGLTAIRLSLSNISGTISSFASDALTAELESKKDAFNASATFASPLAGSITTRQMHLSEIKSVIHVAHSDAPEGAIEGNLTGSASVDGLSRNENVRINLGGKLAGSHMHAELSATVGAVPWLTFTVALDQLDLDRLLPASPAKRNVAERTGDAMPSVPDLSLLDSLENLNVSGSIRINTLKAAGTRSSGVKLDIGPD